MNQYERFHAAIEELIALNQSRRSLGVDAKTMHPEMFAAEFCTVRADIGRRAGKSEFIRKNMTAPSTALVVAEDQWKSMLYPGVPNVYAARELLMQDRGHYNASTVFVDEPSIVFRNMPESTLYRVFTDHGRAPTFVLLGA